MHYPFTINLTCRYKCFICSPRPYSWYMYLFFFFRMGGTNNKFKTHRCWQKIKLTSYNMCRYKIDGYYDNALSSEQETICFLKIWKQGVQAHLSITTYVYMSSDQRAALCSNVSSHTYNTIPHCYAVLILL